MRKTIIMIYKLRNSKDNFVKYKNMGERNNQVKKTGKMNLLISRREKKGTRY